MGPEAIGALVVLAAKYGPDIVFSIIEACKKKDVTIDDVEKAFAPLKPYSAYNIPDTGVK